MNHFYRLFVLLLACTFCVFGGIQEERAEAAKLQNAGNFRESYDAYVKLVENPQNKGKTAAMDFNMAVNCLQRLNRIGEFDALLKKALEIRPNDWRFIMEYTCPMSNGYILDGKFTRGWPRGGQAMHIDVHFADMLFKARLMVQNMPSPTVDDSDQFYMRLGEIFAYSFGNGLRGARSILTDLTQEPDYLNPHLIGSIVNIQ